MVWLSLTNVNFHIDTIFVTMWCSNTVDHDLFSYWGKISHNVMSDIGWPWLTMVHFHIETIFVTMCHWTMGDLVWPWLSQCDFGQRENICHNVTMVVDHGWPILTMVNIHIETIFVTMRCDNIIDHGSFQYWDNHCQNATLLDFHIEEIFLIM